MARILFCWELGQGSGHVLPALPILQQLKAQGHEVVLALRDVRWLPAVLAPYGFAVLQAPIHPDVRLTADAPQPQTMTDILSLFGFASPLALDGLARAWNHLLDLLRPDVLLASYAPVSMLVARSREMPVALLAFPFELPPHRHPLPPLRPGAPLPAPDADDHVIRTVNAVFGNARRPVRIEQASQIFDAHWTGLMTFKEFDYSAREGVEHLGAMFPPQLAGAIQPQWPSPQDGRRRPRVFAQLKPSLPNLQAIHRELSGIDADFFLVLADAPPETVRHWQAANIHVSAVRVDLDSALRQADAVLCYAGHSTVCACAMAGKPMVLVPPELETMLTALRARSLGLGILPAWHNPQPVAAALHAALHSPRMASAGKAFAQAHAGHDVQREASRAAARIAALAHSDSLRKENI